MGTAYDNLARLLYGLRTSLFIASVATLVSTIIGVTVGLVAGFARGVVDRIIGFFTDVFLSFPFILGALALAPIITGRFAENASSPQQGTALRTDQRPDHLRLDGPRSPDPRPGAVPSRA